MYIKKAPDKDEGRYRVDSGPVLSNKSKLIAL